MLWWIFCDLTKKDCSHTNNTVKVDKRVCVIVQVMCHALMVSSVTSHWSFQYCLYIQLCLGFLQEQITRPIFRQLMYQQLGIEIMFKAIGQMPRSRGYQWTWCLNGCTSLISDVSRGNKNWNVMYIYCYAGTATKLGFEDHWDHSWRRYWLGCKIKI